MYSLFPLLLLVASTSAWLGKRDYTVYDYYALHLAPAIHPENVSAHLGLHYEGPLGELEDHHIFRGPRDFTRDHVQEALQALKARRRRRDVRAEDPHLLDHVLLAKKQELHTRFPRVKRDGPRPRAGVSRRQDAPLDPAVQKGIDIADFFGIADPIFQQQWHLYNHREPGHDINVTGVWEQGNFGKNSTVCIVDDGLDMDSMDLKDNYFAKGSYDFNDQVDDPKPRLSDDRHGTRCAGEVAAGKNDVCGVGVAWESNISGVRILSKVISDADEAVALNYAFQDNDFYSCSWGPPDDGQSMEGPGIIIRRAMLTGVQKGRGGLGTVYVFALGNGAAHDDNCNFDGYVNSIYSISVGGIDHKGLHPYYSEKCSAQLVVTYSSGSGDAIHTTDVGVDSCYTNHGGTSAAGPLVAGIYALMKTVNDQLSWRDYQWITVLHAVKIEQPSDWQLNTAINKHFSHQFGFGKADAWAFVEAAKTWRPVKPQAWFFSPWLHVAHDIPQGAEGLTSSFAVTRDMLAAANLERLEHVTVTMNVAHTRRGDLSVELRSPSGLVSHLATPRRLDAERAGYVDWSFMSVAHWGESGAGTWTVVVKDSNVNEHSGRFADWRLKLWGESIDARAQGLLPMPNETEDDDHDAPTASATVGTTSVPLPTETGASPGNPTDHIDRPVNAKPASSTTSTSAEPTASTAPPASDDEATASPSPPSALLPHPFPTFGVSKTTQLWIYGSATLIALFLAALAAYILLQRRRRARNSRDAYAFEMVDREDAEEVDGAVKGRGGRRRRRAGELYDAFAAGSEEDFALEDSGDEGEDGEGEGRYRDRGPGDGEAVGR